MAVFNKNELILDRVRNLNVRDYETKRLLFRLVSLEEPSLACTAEGEEVTDAIGALISMLYRTKRATFSATASLLSTDLLALQYGTKKKVADATNKIVDTTYEILTIEDGEVTLSETPINVAGADSVSSVKYIYSMEAGDIATCYEVDTTASADKFSISGKEITVPTGLTGKVYVEYEYETDSALEVSNKSNSFPEMVNLIIYAYFRDKCNENLKYSGKIIAPKAKINPESIEIALTSTGKHPFEFNILSDYCDEEDPELFKIIISGDNTANN